MSYHKQILVMATFLLLSVTVLYCEIVTIHCSWFNIALVIFKRLPF